VLLLLLLGLLKFEHFGGKLESDLLGALLKLGFLRLIVGHDLVHLVEALF